MHMDLWFDLAIRGEPDLERDVIARLGLSDGAKPEPEEEKKIVEVQPARAETMGFALAPAADFF